MGGWLESTHYFISICYVVIKQKGLVLQDTAKIDREMPYLLCVLEQRNSGPFLLHRPYVVLLPAIMEFI